MTEWNYTDLYVGAVTDRACLCVRMPVDIAPADRTVVVAVACEADRMLCQTKMSPDSPMRRRLAQAIIDAICGAAGGDVPEDDDD